MTMETNLYPDFNLTTDNCGEEPINRPVAIQCHGYMIVFKDSDPDHLFALSTNVEQLFSKSTEELWAAKAVDWMPGDLYKVYKNIIPEGQSTSGERRFVTIGEQLYNVIVHHYQDTWIIEMEPTKAESIDYLQALQNVCHNIKACNSEEELYRVTVERIKEITGYDRVMVYQFDQENHGCVTGEAKEPELEPFLGMNYPATDIPKIARDLFLKNKSRVISDIHKPNHQLLFNPNIQVSAPYLDLTYSQLRATSPIHIEYLSNMGVNATLNVALIQNNELWGLIACHHYSAKLISYELRKVLEVISDVFSLTMLNFQRQEQERMTEISKTYAQQFLDHLDLKESISGQLTSNQDILIKLCEADGAAAVAFDERAFLVGHTPSEKELVSLRNWMIAHVDQKVFSTSNFNKDVEIGADFSVRIGGMLAICTSALEESYIFWFRKPVKQKVIWGGNPEKPHEVVRNKEGEEMRLSPRKSFEKWEIVKEGQSLPWKSYEVSMAEHIQEAIFLKQFQRAAKKVAEMKEEYMQLTYIASHDLLQPVQTVRNYLDLLFKLVKDIENEDIEFYQKRTNLALERMSDLLQDLLNYSRIGKTNEKEKIPINEVLQEIIEDLHVSIESSNASIELGDFPVMKGSRSELRHLFQNLISNSLKYSRKDETPEIKLWAKKEGNYYIFNISDNGIGINEQFFKRIFEMFQRLHSRDNYAGTGIGLAIVKKIVDGYDGKISVTSEVGKGTTFMIKIHEVNFIKNS